MAKKSAKSKGYRKTITKKPYLGKKDIIWLCVIVALLAVGAFFLFRYDDGKLTSLAKEGYTVTLKEGYYEVTGLSGDTEMTLAIAVKKACFPWWILIVIAIILCVLFLYFLGRSKSEEAKKEAKKEEATAPAEEAGEKDAKEEKKE